MRQVRERRYSKQAKIICYLKKKRKQCWIAAWKVRKEIEGRMEIVRNDAMCFRVNFNLIISLKQNKTNTEMKNENKTKKT